MPQRGFLVRGLALLLAASALAGAGQAAPQWSAGAGAVHRRLVERAADGTRLVKESGPLLELKLATELQLPGGGALRAGAGLAGGELDYEGQLQSGVPVASSSRHGDASIALAWRPHAPHPAGAAWLSLRALQQRRDIASTATAQGLDETSRLLLAGLRLEHGFQAGGWDWEPWVDARFSLNHRLHVDYGGVFDASGLRGGRRREFELGLGAAPAGSRWRFELAWTAARQSAGDRATLYRGGSAIGTVQHPRITIDDVALRARRAF